MEDISTSLDIVSFLFLNPKEALPGDAGHKCVHLLSWDEPKDGGFVWAF